MVTQTSLYCREPNQMRITVGVEFNDMNHGGSIEEIVYPDELVESSQSVIITLVQEMMKDYLLRKAILARELRRQEVVKDEIQVRMEKDKEEEF